MKYLILLCSLVLLVSFCSASNKKKSIKSKVPWPGFPFARPPNGYFPSGISTETDEIYEDYDLGSDAETYDTETRETKSDYRPSNAFKTGLASAMHDFTFDLYSEMSRNWTGEKNGMISPLSIYTALSMVTLGLGGNSNAQAMKILRGDAFHDLHEEMAGMCESIYRKNEDITITKANRIFVDRSIRLMKDFKYSMKKDYKVTAKKVNFRNAPELNRKRINEFVARKTQSRIRNLAPQGSVTSDTRLFIVNAMYLKASWTTAFHRTAPGVFHVSPGERIRANLMQTSGGDCFSEMNNELNANVVRIGMLDDISMILFVPTVAGDFSLFEDSQGKQRIRSALEIFYEPSYSRWPQMCRITMPKFKVMHTAEDLIDCLKNMGMTDVFNPLKADFSEMTDGPEPLYVSDIRHKATIDVNEKGLEAAAATSIGISPRMLPQAVVIDRPFLFIVRDDITGANLFTGKIVKPNYK